MSARAAAWAVGLVAALAAVGFVEREHFLENARLDAQLRAAEERITRLQAVKRQADAFTAKRKTLQRKLELIERLMAARPRCPGEVLAALSSPAMAAARVEAVSYENGVVALVGAPDSKAARRDVEPALAQRGFEIAQAGGSEGSVRIRATLSPSFCKEPR